MPPVIVARRGRLTLHGGDVEGLGPIAPLAIWTWSVEETSC